MTSSVSSSSSLTSSRSQSIQSESKSSTSTTSDYQTKKITICSQCVLRQSSVNWPGVDSRTLGDRVMLTVRRTGEEFSFRENGVFDVDFDGTNIRAVKVGDHDHESTKDLINSIFAKLNKASK